MIHRYARILQKDSQHGDGILFGEVIGEILHVLSENHHGGKPLSGTVVPLHGVTLLPPVAPSKVVAVALNYIDHAREMNKPVPEEPMFFIKPSTAIIADGHPIILPPDSENVHHEGELGVVLKKALHNASPEEAREAVLGVTCVNDVTARDIQRRQNHYTRAKGYDTFCPVGPFIIGGLDFSDLRVRTRVNGEVRQDGRTSDMIFDTWKLLSFISHVMTLLPGDLVSTGTPPGVGPLKDGETVEVEIEQVGILRNPVKKAS